MIAVLVIGVDGQVTVVVDTVEAGILVLVISEAVGVVPSAQPPYVEMEVRGECDPRRVAVVVRVQRVQVVS